MLFAQLSLSEGISLVTLVGAVVLTLGRALVLISRIESKMIEIEREFNTHLQSTTLHRNPDSEARWARVERTLEEILAQLGEINRR